VRETDVGGILARRSVAVLCAAVMIVLAAGGCGTSGGPSAVQPLSTATATVGSQPGWQSYVDAKFGFRVDVPATYSEVQNLQDATSSSIMFQGSANNTPFGGIGILGSTNGPCRHGTQPVTVGPGIPAYEGGTGLGTPTPQPPQGGEPAHIFASFVSRGLYIEITLYGSPDASGNLITTYRNGARKPPA
jgi:hypothetical protein